MDRREKGNFCESLAADYLAEKGHRIICRNYRCPLGELDIISIHDGILCVTEVKSLTRRWNADDIRFMVTPLKMARMRKALSHFLANNEVEGFKSIRFDVAAVTSNKVEYYCGD